jgi:putative oxidoreductase
MKGRVMGVVFLITRFILGGYFAWRGAQHLDAYGRHQLVAYARTKNLPMPLAAVPLFGLVLTIGGVSLVTGLFPAAGVAMLWGFLIPAAFLMHRFWRIDDATARAIDRRAFVWNVALAIVALALLLVPQPWPMTVGS